LTIQVLELITDKKLEKLYKFLQTSNLSRSYQLSELLEEEALSKIKEVREEKTLENFIITFDTD